MHSKRFEPTAQKLRPGVPSVLPLRRRINQHVEPQWFVREVDDRLIQAGALESDVSTIDKPLPVRAFSFAPTDTELRERFDTCLKKYQGSPSHRRRMSAYGLAATEINPILLVGEQRR